MLLTQETETAASEQESIQWMLDGYDRSGRARYAPSRKEDSIMPFGIMRVEKRHRPALTGLEAEANRTQHDHEAGRDFARSDIDWNRTDSNIRLIQTDDWHRAVAERCEAAGAKIRNDSVLVIDAFYGASPEFIKGLSPEQMQAYFMDCLQFHIREYCGGDMSRLINAVIHVDEATPHMQVASVPLVDRGDGTAALSAKKLLGGHAEYRARQDRFYTEVSSRWGLDRGARSDPAERRKHLDVQAYKIAEREKELADLHRQLAAMQTATEALQASIEASSAKGGIEVRKTIKPLFGASEPLVAVSQKDFERLTDMSRYHIAVNRVADAARRLDAAVDRLSQSPEERAAHDVAKSHLMTEVMREREARDNVYRAAIDKANRYDRLVGQFPDRIRELEKQLDVLENTLKRSEFIGHSL